MGEFMTRQACYGPVIAGRARDIGPLVRLTGVKPRRLAAGHDSWGSEWTLDRDSHKWDVA